ncbi:MAG: helix-turn-helix domain-containing protein, partial [Microbacterium sp.]
VAARRLEGRGWAVGALLRPAAVGALATEPVQILDREVRFEASELRHAVSRAMGMGESHRDRAVGAFSRWLRARVGEANETGLLANRAIDVLITDDTVLRPADVATRFAMSVRSLERLTHRYVGLPPAVIIRRRRLQEAAAAIRAGAAPDLATLAADLGYADHAHLTNDFRTVLGFTPSAYRSAVG